MGFALSWAHCEVWETQYWEWIEVRFGAAADFSGLHLSKCVMNRDPSDSSENSPFAEGRRLAHVHCSESTSW